MATWNVYKKKHNSDGSVTYVGQVRTQAEDRGAAQLAAQNKYGSGVYVMRSSYVAQNSVGQVHRVEE